MALAAANLTRVGPYDILELVGEGGMGRVYRAHDDRLGRDVAIKVLAAASDPGSGRQQRFLQEARAAGALSHPNIVAVYDVGTDGSVVYIVSELVDGRSLRAELDAAPPNIERALQWAIEIADGLAAAHQAGFVHRDLKPDNIMITRGGRVKIVDFGLAKATVNAAGTAASDQTLTAPHAVLGTASYMSPEQARGGVVDFRSDHFSFGAVLYEMLTRRRAFEGSTAIETLSSVLTGTPAPVTEVCRGCPANLVRILERCLAKSPTERYAATADLLHDLRAVQRRGGPMAVMLPGRARLRRVAVGLGVLAAGGLVAAAWTMAGERGVDLSAYRNIPFAIEAAYEGSAAWSPDGRYLAYVAEINGVLQVMVRAVDVAGTAVSSAPAIQLTDAPVDCLRPFWSTDRSSRSVYYISQARDRDGLWRVSSTHGPRTLEIEDVSEAAMAPDGSIVFLRELWEERTYHYGLWIKPPGGEATRFAADWVGGGSVGTTYLRFSPDGTRFALWASPISKLRQGLDNVELWTFDYPSGRPRRVLPSLHLPRAPSLSWMSDNRHIVFGSDFVGVPSGSHLWKADLETGKIDAVTSMTASEYDPAVSPNGESIAFTSDSSNFDVLEIPTDGTGVITRLGTSRDEADPVWAAGGRQFVYATNRNGEPEIWLEDPSAPLLSTPVLRASQFTDGPTFHLSRLAVSPGRGDRLVYQRRYRAGYHLFTSTLGSGPPGRLVDQPEYTYQDSPTWSPDGQSIAFTFVVDRFVADRSWGLARVRPGAGEAPTVLVEGLSRSCDPRWSPADRYITCQQDDGLYLLSVDGAAKALLTDEVWLAHDWAGPNKLLGLRESDEMRLQLVSIDIPSRQIAVLNHDLGPSPPALAAVRGFSVSPDGRRVLTSVLRLRGDIYLLKGFPRPGRAWPSLGWRRP